MQQKTWLLVFAFITFMVGSFLILKKPNKKSKKELPTTPNMADPADLINPFSWIIFWIGGKIPNWGLGLLVNLLGIYFLYLYFR